MDTNNLECLDCETEFSQCIMKQRKVREVLTEAEHTKKLSYDNQERIIKRGERVIGFYIVCGGFLRKASFAIPDQEITLRVLKKGDMLFGSSFFTDSDFYSTTAGCITPVEVIFIQKEVFSKLMGVAGRGVGMKIAKNMVDLKENLEITAYSMLVQVAYWLIKLPENLISTCSISNKMLSKIIGCSPVTLSNKLGWLEERDLIIREGQKIVIPSGRNLLEKVKNTSDFGEPLEHYFKV